MLLSRTTLPLLRLTSPAVTRHLAARCAPSAPLASAAALAPQRFAAQRALTTAAVLRSPTNPADTHGQTHWRFERLISVALVPMIGAAFVAPGPAVDMALAVAVPLHNYLGMDVVIDDYIPRSIRGGAKGLNLLVAVATIGGLVYFNLNDVGICQGVKSLWAL